MSCHVNYNNNVYFTNTPIHDTDTVLVHNTLIELEKGACAQKAGSGTDA